MYKILVVDDEPLICDGLRSLLERVDDERVSFVETSIHPVRALEMMYENCYDIVFTDIRMPEIDGLELMRRVQNRLGDTKFVVLSGYDDFKYVKEAFKLGVQDYLLKPAEYEEVKNVLRKTLDTLQKEKYNLYDGNNLTHNYSKLVAENLLNRYVFGCEDDAGKMLAEIIKNPPLSMTKKYFSAASFYFVPVSNEPGRQSFEKEHVIYEGKLAKTAFFNDDINIFYFTGINNELAFMVNCDDEEKCLQWANKLLFNFIKKYGNKGWCGLSSFSEDILDIRRMYKEASETLENRIFLKESGVIEYKPAKHSYSKCLNDEFAKYKEHIASLNINDALNLLDAVFSDQNAHNYGLRQYKKFYQNVLNAISDIYYNNSDDQGLLQDYKDFSTFVFLGDIRMYLKSHTINAINFLKDKNKERSAVEKVKKYVEQNISKDIDMAFAANLVNMSYTYFSSLFKKETGMTFSQYVTKVKMEKAMELLNECSYKINEIASVVGYDNPKHFSRAFKSYFGITPTEFRDSIGITA